MTAGLDPAKHSALPPRDDREALSALFDGELPHDAVRFALRRMEHDVAWRETCGRWQLIGDALRGQATAAAPAEFAPGVMRALAQENRAPMADTVPAALAGDRPQRSRRYFLGGAALAASVAVAALLVIRPVSQPAGPSQQLATQGAAEVESGAAPERPVASVATTPPASSAGEPASTRSVAPEQRVAVGRPRIPRRDSSQPATTAPQADDAIGTLPLNAVARADSSLAPPQPFQPPAEDIITRPWPRAVLPGTASDLTVGVGQTLEPSPSFYPFEPRLPADPSSHEGPQPQR